MQSKSNHNPSWICRRNVFHREVSAIHLERPFDIRSLGSEILMKLFHEANSLTPGIRIEIVPSKEAMKRERISCPTIGLPLRKPTIQFTDWLSRIEQEAVAHELVHLLLLYRYGLGVIGRKIPRTETATMSFVIHETGRELGIFTRPARQYSPSFNLNRSSKGKIRNRKSSQSTTPS